MELHIFRHLWGITESWEAVFPRIQAEGYIGIEARLPDEHDTTRFTDLLKAYKFAYIPQIFTAGKTVDEHIASFQRDAERASQFSPTLINCHTGRDAWTMEENERFYRAAAHIEKSIGLPVAHETHRIRSFYNPWTTKAVLERVEGIRLCCDFSHWCCVCERLLEDVEDIIALCASRCTHVHARVGHQEGPQVSDPAAPEYQSQLAAHERWWDMIWDSQEKQGLKASTLTPEFGPPGYMQTLPYTRVHVSDLWSICNWQAKRQADRFAARAGSKAQS